LLFRGFPLYPQIWLASGATDTHFFRPSAFFAFRLFFSFCGEEHSFFLLSRRIAFSERAFEVFFHGGAFFHLEMLFSEQCGVFFIRFSSFSSFCD